MSKFIVFIALFIVSQASLAETFLEKLVKLREDIAQLDKKQGLKCPELKQSTEIFYIGFEGALQYNPVRALVLKAFNGEYLDYVSMTEGCVYQSRTFNNKEKCVQVVSQLYLELYKSRSSHLINYFFKNNLINSAGDFQWNYYGQNHTKEAFECVMKLKKQRPDLEIKLVGYSWGADTAYNLLRRLWKNDIEVKGLFTFDPVSKKGVLANLITSLNNPKYKKRGHEFFWFNMFQKQDTRNIWFGGVRGSSIEEADINFEVTEDMFDKNDKGFKI